VREGESEKERERGAGVFGVGKRHITIYTVFIPSPSRAVYL
jgi:hypothetical protein